MTCPRCASPAFTEFTEDSLRYRKCLMCRLQWPLGPHSDQQRQLRRFRDRAQRRRDRRLARTGISSPSLDESLRRAQAALDRCQQGLGLS